MIDYLASNQVFVFGSNATGFHGAGAAGLGLRGDHRNNWKKDETFRLAMRSPEGSPHRVGKWAVFGVARGFQQGGRASLTPFKRLNTLEKSDQPPGRRSISNWWSCGRLLMGIQSGSF